MSITAKKELSIYIHIPFCISRCMYCDFNTYARVEHLIPDYFEALKKEIIHYSKNIAGRNIVHSIYFGGGTPSIIAAFYLEEVISLLQTEFEIKNNAEITIEMNPNGITKNYLDNLISIGINRISIGMQSSNDNELKMLGRRHLFNDVIQCVTDAKITGFQNISLDLMFGLPTQTLESLIKSVKNAVSLSPEHLSIYGLSLHKGTAMQQQISNGKLAAIDDDLAGDMYDWLIEHLKVFGYEQYEISNWSRGEKFQSKHNLQYWLNKNYLGIGAGAHSHVECKRWFNVNPIEEYIKNSDEVHLYEPYFSKNVQEINYLDKLDEIKETMMMGLRLTQRGVNLDEFTNRFNMDIEDIYSKQIEKLSSLGLIEYANSKKDKCLRLTKRGRMLGNQVFMEFI